MILCERRSARLIVVLFITIFNFSLCAFSLMAQQQGSLQTKKLESGEVVAISKGSVQGGLRAMLQDPPPQMDGFPQQMTGATDVYSISSCRLADLDGDGDLELIAGSLFGPSPYLYGKLYVWQHNGDEYPGWEGGCSLGPYGYSFENTTAIGDIEGIGSKDIVISNIVVFLELIKMEMYTLAGKE